MGKKVTEIDRLWKENDLLRRDFQHVQHENMQLKAKLETLNTYFVASHQDSKGIHHIDTGKNNRAIDTGKNNTDINREKDDTDSDTLHSNVPVLIRNYFNFGFLVLPR